MFLQLLSLKMAKTYIGRPGNLNVQQTSNKTVSQRYANMSKKMP